MNLIQTFLRTYRTALIWALFVLLVCGVNGKYIPEVHFMDFIGPDKLAHIGLFGLQAWFIYRDDVKHRRLIAFLISAGYGIIIEILQATVFTGRSYDYADMLANALGAGVFALFANSVHLQKFVQNKPR